MDNRYKALEDRDPEIEYEVIELLIQYLIFKKHLRCGSKKNIISKFYTFFSVNKVTLPRNEEVIRVAKRGSTPPFNKSRWINVEGLKKWVKMAVAISTKCIQLF